MGIPSHVAIAHEFGMFARFTRRLRRRLAGRAHARFAAVSEPVADDLRGCGVDSPEILPNTIDLHVLGETMRSRADARASLGIPASAFAIGVIGRLHPKKDPLRALGAFERYRRENARALLVFVGDGPLRDRLQRSTGEGVVYAGFRADARSVIRARRRASKKGNRVSSRPSS